VSIARRAGSAGWNLVPVIVRLRTNLKTETKEPFPLYLQAESEAVFF